MHRIGTAHNDWERKYCVSPETFAAHMDTLARSGWKAIAIDDFFAWLDGGAKLVEGAFLLTFDDGFEDVYQNAWPLLWLAFSLCALDSRGAADGERVVDGYPIKDLVVTEEGGELGVEADYLSESRKLDGGDSLDYRNMAFEEYLRYRLNGYVYHPRFLTFRTQFKLGFYQQMIKRAEGPKGDDEDESSSAVLREYDVYVRLLKDHLLSVDVTDCK